MVVDRAELARIMKAALGDCSTSCCPLAVRNAGSLSTFSSRIAFIAAPMRQCCGTPFECTVAERSLRGRCLPEPPVYGRARAATLYDDAGRGSLLRFKHGDGLHWTGLLGAWLAQARISSSMF